MNLRNIGQARHGVSSRELGPREMETLRLTALGMSPREIGEQLHISAKTVSTYKDRLKTKLGINTNQDIVKYAIKAGMISLDYDRDVAHVIPVTQENCVERLKNKRAQLSMMEAEATSLLHDIWLMKKEIIDIKAAFPNADDRLACDDCPPASMDVSRCKACPREF